MIPSVLEELQVVVAEDETENTDQPLPENQLGKKKANE